mmetsp:Transcript_282/g.749  ORF Transcript_282/g.749 Transcript_282/m.749 type:complete len:186 (+) Transcript_282:51-608(+)
MQEAVQGSLTTWASSRDWSRISTMPHKTAQVLRCHHSADAAKVVFVQNLEASEAVIMLAETDQVLLFVTPKLASSFEVALDVTNIIAIGMSRFGAIPMVEVSTSIEYGTEVRTRPRAHAASLSVNTMPPAIPSDEGGAVTTTAPPARPSQIGFAASRSTERLGLLLCWKFLRAVSQAQRVVLWCG